MSLAGVYAVTRVQAPRARPERLPKARSAAAILTVYTLAAPHAGVVHGQTYGANARRPTLGAILWFALWKLDAKGRGGAHPERRSRPAGAPSQRATRADRTIEADVRFYVTPVSELRIEIVKPSNLFASGGDGVQMLQYRLVGDAAARWLLNRLSKPNEDSDSILGSLAPLSPCLPPSSRHSCTSTFRGSSPRRPLVRLDDFPSTGCASSCARASALPPRRRPRRIHRSQPKPAFPAPQRHCSP